MFWGKGKTYKSTFRTIIYSKSQLLYIIWKNKEIWKYIEIDRNIWKYKEKYGKIQIYTNDRKYGNIYHR